MNDDQIAAMAAADPTNNDWGQGVDPGERKVNHQIARDFGANGGFSAKYYGGWHELGTVIKDPNVTALQLLQAAGGDYPIFSAPISSRIDMPVGPSSPITMPVDVVDPLGRVNIMFYHPTTGIPGILGQASKDYPLWSNRDIFLGYADQIIDDAAPTASTCVVMYGGRQTVMSFELPESIAVGGFTDEAERPRIWVVVSTSYDQSIPTTTHLTTIRPVCANTLRAGKAQQFAKYVVRKTKNADLKVQMAREALKLVPKFTEAAKAEWDDLLAVHVTDAKFEEIVKDLFGPGEDANKIAETLWEQKWEKLDHLWSKADTQANVRNTAYGMVNVVTEYADHLTKVKAGSGMTDGAVRLWRSVTGEKSVTRPKIAIEQRALAMV